MIVDLVGIGMDGGATLTLEAQEAISKAQLLIGAKRMLEAVPEDDRERFYDYDAQEIANYIANSKAKRAAILLSGDIGFFSGAKRLTDALGGHSVRLIAGISSVVYFCSKIAMPWENMRFISLHGTQQNVAVHVRSNARTFFLLGGEMTAGKVCAKLCEYGLESVKIHIGERLGYPDERILSGTAMYLANTETSALSVMVAENSRYIDYLPTCIPDADFARGSVPMTKSEVRGVSVSGLEIRRHDICWDIGCGTGSVSVEMALRCPDGRVFAIDKNTEATSLTLANARKFACDHILVTNGIAPDDLEGFPKPDKVFIGGTGGDLDAILDVISRKNPDSLITINAVTLETLADAQLAFRSRGGDCTITQIAVTQTRKISDYTMLSANNPVFIIRGRLR